MVHVFYFLNTGSQIHAVCLKMVVKCLYQFYKNLSVHLNFFPQHDEDPIAGYLSLHKSNESMLLKWTPNKLMSGSCEREKSQFWDYALTVNLHDVVYIHCHQHGKLLKLLTLLL